MRYVYEGEEVSKKEYEKRRSEYLERQKEDDDSSSSNGGGGSSSSSSSSGDPRKDFKAEAERRGFYTKSGAIKKSKLGEYRKLYDRMVKDPRELEAYKREGVPVVSGKPKQPGETQKEYEQRVDKAVSEKERDIARKAAESKAAETRQQATAVASLKQRREAVARQKASEKIVEGLGLEGTDLRDPTRTLASVKKEREEKKAVARTIITDLGLAGTDLRDKSKTIKQVKEGRDRVLVETKPPSLLSGSQQEALSEASSQGQTTTTSPQIPVFYKPSSKALSKDETRVSDNINPFWGELAREFGAGFSLRPSPTTNLRGVEGFEAAITGRNPRTGREESQAAQGFKRTAWLGGTVLAIGSGSVGRTTGAALQTTRVGVGVEKASKLFRIPFVRGASMGVAAGSTALAAATSKDSVDFARTGANILKTGALLQGVTTGVQGAGAYRQASVAARSAAKPGQMLQPADTRALRRAQELARATGRDLQLRVSEVQRVEGVGQTTTTPKGTVKVSDMRVVTSEPRTVSQIPKTSKYTLLDTKATKGLLVQPPPPKAGTPGTKTPARLSDVRVVAPRQYGQTTGRRVDVVKTSAFQRQISGPRAGGRVVETSSKPRTGRSTVNQFEAFRTKPYGIDVDTPGRPVVQAKLTSKQLKALRGFREYQYNFESGRQVAKGFEWNRPDLMKKAFGTKKNPVYILESKPKVSPKTKTSSFAERSFQRAKSRMSKPDPSNVATAADVTTTTIGATGGSFLKGVLAQAKTLGVTPAVAAKTADTQKARTVATSQTVTPADTISGSKSGVRGPTPSGVSATRGGRVVGDAEPDVKPSTGSGVVVGGTSGSGVYPVYGGGSKRESVSDDSIVSRTSPAESPADGSSKVDLDLDTRIKDMAGSRIGGRAGSGVTPAIDAVAKTGTTTKINTKSKTTTTTKTDTLTDTQTRTDRYKATTKTSKPRKTRYPYPPTIPKFRKKNYERGMTKIFEAMSKVRGRWTKVGVAEDKLQAQRTAAWYASRTPAASIAVREKGKKDFEKIRGDRFFKRKKKGGSRILVEKNKYRISSPGEKAGITLKGISASRKKNKKMRGLKL